MGTWTTYELLHASPSRLYDTLMVRVDPSVREIKNKNDLKKKFKLNIQNKIQMTNLNTKFKVK